MPQPSSSSSVHQDGGNPGRDASDAAPSPVRVVSVTVSTLGSGR